MQISKDGLYFTARPDPACVTSRGIKVAVIILKVESQYPLPNISGQETTIICRRCPRLLTTGRMSLA